MSGIQYSQKSTDHLICWLSFQGLIQEQVQNLGYTNFWFQAPALNALQEAMEAYLGGLFKDTNLCAHHVKWIAIIPKDMQLVRGHKKVGPYSNCSSFGCQTQHPSVRKGKRKSSKKKAQWGHIWRPC